MPENLTPKKKMSRTLVPLSGDPVAESVLPYAIMAANWFNSELNLLHVLRPSNNLRPVNSYKRLSYPDIQQDRSYNLANAYLQEIVARIKPYNSNVRWGIATGGTARTIANRAATLDVNLITLTSGILSRWERLLHAGILKDLWDITSAPLLVIKERLLQNQESGFEVKEPETLIVPVPNSQMIRSTLPFLKELVGKTGAKVAMVIRRGNKGVDSLLPQENLQALFARLDEDTNVTYQFVTDVTTAVENLQGTGRNSWIVTASRMRGMMHRLAFGSFSYRLFKVARSPIVIIPSERVAEQRLARARSETIKPL